MSEMFRFLPWYETKEKEKHNAMSRLILYITLLAFVLRKDVKYVKVGFFVWFSHYFLFQSKKEETYVSEEEAKIEQNPIYQDVLSNERKAEKIIAGPRQQLNRKIITSSNVELIYGERQVRKSAETQDEDTIFKMTQTGGPEKFYLNPKKLD
jgi:hypothetical protein